MEIINVKKLAHFCRGLRNPAIAPIDTITSIERVVEKNIFSLKNG